MNTTTLKLEYRKEELDFSAFQIWYKYRVVTKSLLDAWREKRKTGFKLSWTIENNNPPLQLTTSDVGKTLTTPGFGGFYENFHMADQNFNASLLFPNDLPEQIGNGSLVVELQTEREMGENGKSEFFYTEPGYVLHVDPNYKAFSWTEAEVFCNDRGGHLASAESSEDQRKTVEIADGMQVWLGGKEIEGKWQYSNGEKMTKDHFSSSYGQEPYCAALQGGYLYKRNCEKKLYSFICTLPLTKTTEDMTTIVQSLNRLQVASVPSMKVGYRYQVFNNNNTQQMNMLENKTKAGFKIDWYVKDESGSRASRSEVHQQNEDWKEVINDPGRQNEAFQKVVGLAAAKRLLNVPKEDIINEAISMKLDFLKSQGLDRGNCKNERVLDGDFHHLFQALQKEHSLAIEKDQIFQDDIATGIALYMIGIHCPEETMKLSHFLLQLAEEESFPTFILATVNTLQSGNLTPYHKQLLGRIFQVLDDFFGFHLGKILLATSSPDQLSAIQDQGSPFLKLGDQTVQRCLSGASCKDILNHKHSGR